MTENTNSIPQAAQELENEIQLKKLNAPRLRPDDLKNNIKHVEYVKKISHSGQVLRWCLITTNCGFTVSGRPSVSVSPENDNFVIGEKVAYENTFAELWSLMGYSLKEKLHREQTT